MIFLKHVSKSFGEQAVLKNFSYEFASHGLYRLYGRSGIGKTTLLRIIAGLETPDEGTVQVSGGVSYLFQDRRLFDSLSALENVALVAPKGQTKTDVQKKASDLLSALGIEPQDQTKRIFELSGGMQQRVAIARAFFFPAPILLLDEPTKELDAENRAILRRMISVEAQDRLVILSGHESDDGDYLGIIDICLERD